MNSANIAIQTQNLTRFFGNRVAVDKVSLNIRTGEIFSLLGTNGAGKTTTIKMLTCLLKPTSGSVSVMGYDGLSDTLKIKEIIGVSPQETAIAAHLSTFENLQFMGGVFGLKRNESNQRARKLMDLMELEDRRDKAKKLSGGQQRRLSIAMAMMSDPQILFLDEPTLGLDPHARKSVWNYIEKLKISKTILLTTHYLEEADALADQIAIMDEGKIIESGTSAELKQKHAGSRVLKITGGNVTPNVIDALRSQKLVVNSAQSGIEISGADIDLYTIIDLLKYHKVVIDSIQMKEITLEEVFLKLTGKEGEL